MEQYVKRSIKLKGSYKKNLGYEICLSILSTIHIIITCDPFYHRHHCEQHASVSVFYSSSTIYIGMNEETLSTHHGNSISLKAFNKREMCTCLIGRHANNIFRR